MEVLVKTLNPFIAGGGQRWPDFSVVASDPTFGFLVSNCIFYPSCTGSIADCPLSHKIEDQTDKFEAVSPL